MAMLPRVLTLGNVRDVEQLCRAVLDRLVRQKRLVWTREQHLDAVAWLIGETWRLHTYDYDAKRNPSFASYASWKLFNLAIDHFFRAEYGRATRDEDGNLVPGERAAPDFLAHLNEMEEYQLPPAPPDVDRWKELMEFFDRNALSPRARDTLDVIVRMMVEGWPVTEIAEELGRPVKLIHNAIRRFYLELGLDAEELRKVKEALKTMEREAREKRQKVAA